jgi:hypothetical protein
MRKAPKPAAKPVEETRRFRLRDGFVLHQGRHVRRGGEVVEVTKAEYIAHAHKFEDGALEDSDDDA